MKQKHTFFPVLGVHNVKYKKLDLSILGEIAQNKSEVWYSHLEELPLKDSSVIYYGGYLEQRFFYSNENLFGSGASRRNIHLGVDLWVPEKTTIYAPLDSIVQSIKYNDNELDYGHTIILRHELEEKIFYSLYGHLSSWHCETLKANMKISKGEAFCKIGGDGENGGWPPHLHLQLIQELGEVAGDYPGVASAENIDFYSKNCPDPTHLIF